MPGAGRQTTSAGRAAAASSGSHCTISGVVSSEGHPRPGRKARATAIIAESIFDFQWTFERRGKIFREIAALVIDLDDKERKEPKDAGYKCARHLLEAHRGEVHRAADYSIANGTINQDIIDRLLDVVRFPCENVVVQSHGPTVTAHSSAPC
jgi:hypothetical protein